MAEMGQMLEQGWLRDPKRLAFTFARYKFVAKMLAGAGRVLEAGADSGFMSRIVDEAVGWVLCTDASPAGPGVLRHDFVRDGPYPGRFDAAYALDVLEHVPADRENAFMGNLAASLTPHGTCIIGMPSAESQPYASAPSRAEHVNCKTEEELRALMLEHFHCVYLFGMQDETLHTGFGPMAHYRLALCNTPRVS